MNREFTSIDVDKVVTKEALRRDDGDLSALEASIERLGLLHPIIIDRRNVLISGGRRLKACRALGLQNIPVMRLDTEFDSMESLDIQSDENLCRQPLSPEELEAHIQRKKTVLGGSDEDSQKVFSGIRRMFVSGSK